jgi:hypothetical protein
MNAITKKPTAADPKNGDGSKECESTDSCCTFNINVAASGDVHIHNNCGAPEQSGTGGGGDDCGEGHECPSIGTCLPVVAGAKHKLSRDQKLNARAARDPIGSALATGIMHAMRRYVIGKPAANPLEQQAYTTFDKMPKAFLACNVAAFDGLPAPLRNTLFVPSLLLDTDTAIDVPLLAQALTDEIRQRAGNVLFNEPDVDQEVPGLVRLYVPQGEDFFSQVRICQVDGLRTASFIPTLSPGEYRPDEIQQDCTPTIVNGQAQVVCEVRATNCPGNPVAGVCGRVLDIAQGDGVELLGVNYFSVDTKVRLTNVDDQTITKDVDTFVIGDTTTPLNEVVNGETVLINDCRVQDKLTFQAPSDLPPGIYWVNVIVPNITGNPVFGPYLESNTEFINLLPAPDAKYQVVVEKIVAREETSPSWWGSDEVGLHTITCGLDLSQQPTETNSIEFHALDGKEFDSGDSMALNTVIFKNEQPFLAIVIGVLGYEIDSEHAYHAQITDWTDYFVYAVEEEWKAALAGVTALGGLSALTSLGWVGAIIAGIGVAVVGAIDLLVSFWAPADLIIEDTITLTIVDIDRLTSAYAPAPPQQTYTTAHGIKVDVNDTVPPEKIPLQYKETRQYVCSDQDSRYELTYRYNRLS